MNAASAYSSYIQQMKPSEKMPEQENVIKNATEFAEFSLQNVETNTFQLVHL